MNKVMKIHRVNLSGLAIGASLGAAAPLVAIRGAAEHRALACEGKARLRALLRRLSAPMITKDRASFLQEVVAPLKISIEGKKLTLEQYLVGVPESKRSNDEAAVVDELFSPRLLRWLGYEDGDWEYNRPGAGKRDRPDFRVSPGGSIAFIVEDKNTTEELDPSHVAQMRRYASGTTGYALWTNAREIVAFRFAPQGGYEVLLRLPVWTPPTAELFDASAGFALLHMLFRRARYTELPGILERIAVPEEKWERTPISAPGARDEFIASTKGVLADLATAARAQVEQAEVDLQRARRELHDVVQRLRELTRQLLEALRSVADKAALSERLQDLVRDPVNLDETQLVGARPAQLAGPDVRAWDQWLSETLFLAMQLRERELPRTRLRRIATAFEVWKERFKVIEEESANESSRRQAYAEQVAYTFFVRLLLTRILEDRQVMPRLISNGGLSEWRTFLQRHFAAGTGARERAELLPEALLAVLYRSVSRYYRHFFSQPVFDWFEPDDFVLAVALDRLSRYDFADIQEDILGYTYEAYIDAVARQKKGHYLTPGEVVDLMLDESGYDGREIIGKRVLDMAAGSGSFLVHAARRLRKAVIASEGGPWVNSDEEALHRPKAARVFLRNVQRDLVGQEINPFSCYLAELNLFIQVLDDLVYLGSTGDLQEIDRFQIFNTNSLELPRKVLFYNEQLTGTDQRLDEAWDLKNEAGGTFHFVAGNPPYINRGIVTDAPSYKDIPSYRDILSGDSNTFLLFLKVATYYSAPDGVICEIIPINLLGDGSAEAARRLYSEGQVTLEKIVRFYRREVLFEGVLQRVCIVTARRTDEGGGKITIRGGRTVEEAREKSVAVPRRRVTTTTPDAMSQLWNRAWLVVPDSRHYDVWKHLREQSKTDVEHWTLGRLKFQQGDVNKTRTKVFRTDMETATALPVTCADNVENFGPWERDSWLDPAIDPEAAGLSGTRLRDAEREREERIYRIRDLRHNEAIFALKDTVGMEAIRPLRGSLWTRSGKKPFLTDHTMQIAFPLQARDNTLARAVFGLLVSAVPSYVLQLFSTNAHATRDEILRTPIPEMSDDALTDLAEAATAAQEAGEKLFARLHEVGGSLRLAAIKLSPTEVLTRSKLPTVSLDDAVRNGLVETPEHPQWKVATLSERGELAGRAGAFHEASQLILAGEERTFATAREDVKLPDPAIAGAFLQRYAAAKTDCEERYAALLEGRAELDRQVFGLYDITNTEWQRLILWGVPWAVEGREETERLDQILWA